MIDGFIDTLRSWQNFYFMIGGASAALLGLMFVALSLGQHLINETTRESIEAFAEPNIYYFTSALLISALMLVPFGDPTFFAWVILIGSLIAIARVGYYMFLLIRAAMRHGDFNFGDWAGQVIVPTGSYILLPAAGIMLITSQWMLGWALLAVGTVMVLISGIINTWGMVIWIIYQSKSDE